MTKVDAPPVKARMTKSSLLSIVTVGAKNVGSKSLTQAKSNKDSTNHLSLTRSPISVFSAESQHSGRIPVITRNAQNAKSKELTERLSVKAVISNTGCILIEEIGASCAQKM